MNSFRNIRLGIKTLMLHKLRSLLTMLGVVCGVGSVIAMLAVGEGSKQQALEQIERLGTNNIIVTSKEPAEAAAPGGAQAGSVVLVYGIKYEDEDRVTDTLPGIERTVPVRRIPKTASLADRSMQMDLIGTTPAWFDLVRRDIIAGRTITNLDMQRRAPVVVLTEHAARRLLSAHNTIGEQIQIGDKMFTVIGIVRSESRMEESGGTLDEGKDAFIPLTTCRAMFGELISEESAGQSSREIVDLHQLIIEVSQPEYVPATARTVRGMFDRFHKLPDVAISVPLELLRQREATLRVWNITLGAIAGISLLVGGIGIMNIMLASVTERTREIGIRRAIGAQRNQIVGQFLVEAMLLSVGGGLIGLLLGAWLLPLVITAASGIPTIVPIYSIILSIGISVGVGVVFGLYPALRASQLDPIVALRHE